MISKQVLLPQGYTLDIQPAFLVERMIFKAQNLLVPSRENCGGTLESLRFSPDCLITAWGFLCFQEKHLFFVGEEF